ncbi:mediator of RNA polymerase II transcription subunit 15-like [Drosophila miranda]|uniref:mediator of RNA polymerase II transcription subunit 15-like n=1 Tax=Drosophila miranda TaxID=7229 RepID=UPI00143F8E36|nr:mediator of RNA polymerase II transcription subunit 15-like [Drosophila miranda]XP_033254881.1 mediator of RNA polymerase II transcription subunit 15-like [Drosophila miranda]
MSISGSVSDIATAVSVLAAGCDGGGCVGAVACSHRPSQQQQPHIHAPKQQQPSQKKRPQHQPQLQQQHSSGRQGAKPAAPTPTPAAAATPNTRRPLYSRHNLGRQHQQQHQHRGHHSQPQAKGRQCQRDQRVQPTPKRFQTPRNPQHQQQPAVQCDGKCVEMLKEYAVKIENLEKRLQELTTLLQT